ncbi:diguanylate cyclase [Thiomicrorhabdus sediminis]|uniref:diguanylate cyclase n=1 Tax=Thiomicrorhabdus sediminis TaxID=2580412 RepID=A0A4P9K3P1_9GAMM|nr:diguanylate cyclase [Thiomicrorhabdus sediminis]QCU89512.1 diguanylate cyclase [Thiomicrorhabdus sediminis]
MFRFIYILSLVVTMLSCNIALAQSPTPVKVQINWNHQFQFAGFYAAIQQGYYREAGLDVEVVKWRGGMNVVEEVLSGRAQFGVGYSTLLADYVRGQPIKLVMSGFQYSPMVLLSHEPIDSLEQLSGKRIMHDYNLQIASVLERASTLVNEPVVTIPSSGNLEDFIKHRVDLYSAYTTNEPYRLNKLGVPFYVLDPKSFGIQSYGDFVFTSAKLAKNEPAMVEKFKQATIQGWQYAINHQAEVVDYILHHYPVVKDRESLLAEAKSTAAYIKSGNLPIGSLYKEKLLSTALEAKNAGLISEQELAEFDTEHFLLSKNSLLFTKQELEYIANNPVIKIANDIEWEPFEYVDEHGDYKGIAADFLDVIAQRSGLQVEYVKDKTWAQVVDMAKQGDLDVYSCAVSTPERQKYMEFTEPYLQFPMVIASNDEVGFVNNYNMLSGHKVAVVKGYWSDEYLSIRYPEVELVRFDTIRQALNALNNGEVNFYSGNLASIIFAVRKYGLANIRIAGQPGETFNLSIGVNKSKLVLLGIMEKALASISESERQAIYNRWLGLKVINQVDYSNLMTIVVPLLLLILLLVGVVVLLGYLRNKKQEYLMKVYELSYATLISPDDFQIKWLSQSFRELSGFNKNIKDDTYYLYDLERIDLDDLADIRKQLMDGNTVTRELVARDLSGKSYTALANFSAETNFRNHITAILVTRQDITDKKKIHALAITDELTGLFNRRHFNEVLEQEVKRSQQENLNLCVAMVDVDYFKQVNDTYGHLKGDEVLAKIAKLLSLNFSRSNDYVFRIGGEEFFILSLDCNTKRFKEYAGHMVSAVEVLGIPNCNSEHRVVTISMGIKCYAEGEIPSASEIYSSADKLLYEAKVKGRNQACITD